MMDNIALLSNNIRAILEAKDRKLNKKVSRQYYQDKAENEGYTFSRSNLSKLDNGQDLNFSVDKLEALCVAFGDGLEPWQLLHPNGFNEDGSSLATGSSFSLPKLISAVTKAVDAASASGIENSEFIGRVAALIYDSENKGSPEDLSMQILKISRDY